jgi:acylphosphatase
LVCKLCWVSGRVQGVYYRGTAQSRALELGITGYARNLDDGRVEVLACGEQSRLQKFIDWLWVGPTAAHVASVEVVDHPQASSPPGFTTR